MRKLYAFDVDETLAFSPGFPGSGPVTIADVIQLRSEGHITGLCGNWAQITLNKPYWYQWVSFIGPLSMTKAEFLAHVAKYIPADEYVMVGNDPRVKGRSQDAQAADLAGWRFIREDDFAQGTR